MSDNLEVVVDEADLKSAEELAESIASISKEEYERIRNQALDEAKTRKHSWVQRGKGKIACTSCPFPHTAYIDPSLRLVGLDSQGNPIFDKL